MLTMMGATGGRSVKRSHSVTEQDLTVDRRRTVLILGGDGKSTNGNVFVGTHQRQPHEEVFQEGHLGGSQTREIQYYSFQEQGYRYCVVDTVECLDLSASDSYAQVFKHINEACENKHLRDGISQVFLTLPTSGKFTKAACMLFHCLRAIFADDIIRNCVTVVFTFAPLFLNDDWCKENIRRTKESCTEARNMLCSVANVIHVNNPPAAECPEWATIRERSREKLLHLVNGCSRTYRPLDREELQLKRLQLSMAEEVTRGRLSLLQEECVEERSRNVRLEERCGEYEQALARIADEVTIVGKLAGAGRTVSTRFGQTRDGSLVCIRPTLASKTEGPRLPFDGERANFSFRFHAVVNDLRKSNPFQRFIDGLALAPRGTEFIGPALLQIAQSAFDSPLFQVLCSHLDFFQLDLRYRMVCDHLIVSGVFSSNSDIYQLINHPLQLENNRRRLLLIFVLGAAPFHSFVHFWRAVEEEHSHSHGEVLQEIKQDLGEECSKLMKECTALPDEDKSALIVCLQQLICSAVTVRANSSSVSTSISICKQDKQSCALSCTDTDRMVDVHLHQILRRLDRPDAIAYLLEALVRCGLRAQQFTMARTLSHCLTQCYQPAAL